MVVFSSNGAWAGRQAAAGAAAAAAASAAAAPVALLLCLLLLSLLGKSSLLFEWLVSSRRSAAASATRPRCPAVSARRSLGSLSMWVRAAAARRRLRPRAGIARGLRREGRSPRPAPARDGLHGRPAARGAAPRGAREGGLRDGARGRGSPGRRDSANVGMRRPFIPYGFGRSRLPAAPCARQPHFRRAAAVRPFRRIFRPPLSRGGSRRGPPRLRPPPAPPGAPRPAAALPRVVDFVDALSEAARQAARDDPAPWRRAYWAVEAPRLARAEARAAAGAAVLLATTPFDAAHLPAGHARRRERGRAAARRHRRTARPVVAFTGRLMYRPNRLARATTAQRHLAARAARRAGAPAFSSAERTRRVRSARRTGGTGSRS